MICFCIVWIESNDSNLLLCVESLPLILLEMTELLKILLLESLHLAITLLVPRDDLLWQEHVHGLALKLFNVGRS